MTTGPRRSPGDFGELVDMHQAEILRYLRRLTGNLATAEDLFQDTFLRAFGGFARLRAGSNHRVWLYRIATNLFLNHRRATGRRAVCAGSETSFKGRTLRGEYRDMRSTLS